ncbi:MAG TPA: DsbA family protein [Actinomycetota bacterium]|nr:DsbA family protein [Actinomycetota bacterium]
MPDALAVYFDYTCRYSYRAMHWLDLIPDLTVEWRTFSLKEVNKEPDEPSWLQADSTPSLSVLAQALAHAAREGDFGRYHHAVFEAMHGEERRLSEDDFYALAAEAGVDVEAFKAERGAWVARVGAEHYDAAERLGAYGTPTVVLDGAASYIRLAEVPGSESEARAVVDALDGIASSPANLVEIFRPPQPHDHAPVQIGRPPG